LGDRCRYHHDGLASDTDMVRVWHSPICSTVSQPQGDVFDCSKLYLSRLSTINKIYILIAF